jgi:uncharacterized protein (TIGR03086 family)
VTTALAGAVELLERSLGYTRTALVAVRSDDLGSPTPCRRWTLGQLLAHMEDGLDAFTEAAGGQVTTTPTEASRPAVDRLQVKACHLLGLWSGAPPAGVDVEGARVATELLVATAALEITVHGWDVARAVRLDHAVPEAFAGRLLDVAGLVVTPEDRGVRFDEPVPQPPGASYAARLLGHLGRT